MWPWARLLFQAGTQYAITEMMWRGFNNRQNLKKILVGFFLLVIAAAMAIVTLTLLLAAIFFQLAGFESLVWPALFTGGLTFLIVALSLLEGFRRFHP